MLSNEQRIVRDEQIVGPKIGGVHLTCQGNHSAKRKRVPVILRQLLELLSVLAAAAFCISLVRAANRVILAVSRRLLSASESLSSSAASISLNRWLAALNSYTDASGSPFVEARLTRAV